MPNDGRKTLVVIFGPPAVGKMTVGLALERLTGLRLFHNHMTVDPVLRLFPFGSAPYKRLVGEFRRRIFEEAAASDLPGLIFTYVWALDQPSDRAFVDGVCDIFRAQGADVWFVELHASQDERLRRNETPLRLQEKEPKRNLEASRRLLLEADATYRLNTDGDFFYPDRFIRIDNTALPPEAVATMVVERLGIATQNPTPHV